MIEAPVEVRYSNHANCDDALVAWAVADGASILSPDRDMFRYKTETRVYGNFQVEDDTLLVCEHRWHTLGPYMPGPAPRRLPSKPPFLSETDGGNDYFGAPSPLIRERSSNPHHTLEPLRAALYFLKGLDAVDEEIPTWRYDRVRFIKKKVRADRTFCHLLLAESPLEAFEHFFPEETKSTATNPTWIKHVIACKTLCAQLWCAYNERPLLEQVRLFY